MVDARPFVAAYADESCLGNGREGDNPGGAGVLIEYRQGQRIVRRDLWVSEPATTNNRMALRSVIETFTALARKGRTFRVLFTTDSRYIVDGMTQWVHDWARRGWRRKSGPIENLELWQAAVEAAAPHDVAWRWVRGHNGHAQNEFANDLAMHAAGTLTSSGGLIESGFDAWLAARTPPLEPDPFPDPASFRATARLPAASGGRH
ncbi:MAG: ribonuclease H [Gemmatimonadaceae bacterium]